MLRHTVELSRLKERIKARGWSYFKIAGFAVSISMMTTGILNSLEMRSYLELSKYVMRYLRIQVNKRTNCTLMSGSITLFGKHLVELISMNDMNNAKLCSNKSK